MELSNTLMKHEAYRLDNINSAVTYCFLIKC